VTTPVHRTGNLPAEVTSFIGRRRELGELRRKLNSARLVSLVGPGGVGKTRLAIRVAADLERGFTDGAWLVELADVQGPGQVANAFLSALDLRHQTAAEPRALLLAYVRDKELLLVIDNCEHLLGPAGSLIAEILKAAPSVRVIATSREPLSVAGEHVVPVPPLDLPSGDGAEPLGRLSQNEAVMLFTERAAAASGHFELAASNRAAVVDLCRRLDGLPLAIELAAVRTVALSPEQIRARLSDRFSLLSRGGLGALPRHQTLHAAIDWSHELLASDERTLLRRLCVFAGRFTLEDVEAVCAFGEFEPEASLDLLSSLVEKSLVVKEEAIGIACYRLHETMREYAVVKLKDEGERELVEERCVNYYTAKCGRSAAEARYGLVAWLGWMEIEIDNIRAILRRCVLRADHARGLNLASYLAWYWITRATAEGAGWFEELLGGGEGSPEGRAQAYFMLGFLSVLRANPAAAAAALELAVTGARATGQQRLLSESLSMASIAAGMLSDHARAGVLLEEAGDVAHEGGEPTATLALLQARALNAFFKGDIEAVLSASTAGEALSRELGDLYSLGMMLLNLGLAALTGGNLEQAGAKCAEGLHLAHQIDDRVAQFYLIGALGCRAAVGGNSEVGATLLGAAEGIRESAGLSVNAILAPLLSNAQQLAISSLGEARYSGLFGTGRRLSRDQATALALGESASGADAATESAAVGPLGRRETDVARLVADGLSNKQIGARLFISERTVESHVRSALDKLGFNTRAQIAGWMAMPNP